MNENSEHGNIFDNIRQNSKSTWNPIRVEKFHHNGHRMTKAYYDFPYEYELIESADKWMTEASNFPEILTGSISWHFIIPWLQNEDAELVNFWSCYDIESAEKERIKAVNGLKFLNRTNENILISSAHEYKALTLQQYGFELGKDERPLILASLKYPESTLVRMKKKLEEKMIDWVLDAIWNDHDAPKRLHELLKNKKAIQSEYQNQPTVDSRIFNAFVQTISDSWLLPTKKIVKNKAGFGNDSEDHAAASRSFKKLGLNGLPGA